MDGGGLGPGLLSPGAGGGGGGGGGVLLLLEQIVQDLLQPENVHVDDQKCSHKHKHCSVQRLRTLYSTSTFDNVQPIHNYTYWLKHSETECQQ